MPFSCSDIVGLAGGLQILSSGVDVQDAFLLHVIVVDGSGVVLIEFSGTAGIPCPALGPSYGGIGIEAEPVIDTAKGAGGCAGITAASKEQIPGVKVANTVGLGGIEVVADVGDGNVFHIYIFAS